MTVATSAPTIVPRSAPNRTPPQRTVEPLQGTPARIVAGVQGALWHGLVADAEILDAVAVRRQLDQRGDAIRRDLIDGLGRVASMAKRAGQYDLHSVLVDLLAAAIVIDELDDAEDTHDDLIAGAATGSRTWLMRGNVDLAALLGQKLGVDLDADIHCDLLEQAWPLDGGGICGRQRQPMGSLRFETCDQPVNHERRGMPCVFVAVAPQEGATS